MARLQSSPLLRRNHGNASNTDPDAAAPYPEFPLLLPSADTQLYTVGPKKKRVQKNLSKEDKQNVTVSRVQLSCQNYWPALKVPTQVADGWYWGWLTCFYFRSCICTNSSKDNPTTNLCVFQAPSLEEWVTGWQHSGPYLVLLQASCSVNKRILQPCATSHFYFLCSLKGCGRESRHSDYGLAS